MLLALALSLAVLQEAEEPPRVECRLEADRLYVGESVRYEVNVINLDQPPRPALPGIEGIEAEFLGDQSTSSSFTMIVNGQVQSRNTFGHVFVYRLTPGRSGTYSVPGPSVSHGRDTLQGNAVTLFVRDPDEQDVVFLDVAADRELVYPMQPFRITLDVMIRALPVAAGGKSLDPLQVVNQPPGLRVPWIEVPDGLRSRSMEEWLRPYLDRARRSRRQGMEIGFTINDLSAGDSLFLLDRRAGIFLPESEWIVREGSDGLGDYKRYRLVREFEPLETGEFRFGSVSLKGTLATGMEAGKLQGDRIYAVSNAVTVAVRPPPLEGRPGSFTGGIGRFTLGAALAPTRARVGDPMTLTLTVRGSGTLEDITPPDLESVPGLADGFKTYDATSETAGRERVFSYSLRPLAETVRAFPAVPLTFFDPEAEEYVTAYSEPIPVTIEAADNLGAGDIVRAPGEPMRPSAVEASGGFFANYTDASSLLERRLAPGALAAWCGALLAGYAALAGVVLRRRRLHGDPAILRRRRAFGRARERLAAAQALLQSGDLRSGFETLHGAFGGLLADVSDRPEEGLTPREIEALARDLGARDDVAGALRTLLEEGDAARFGAAAGNVTDLADRAGALLDQLLPTLRKPRARRSSRSRAGALLLLAALLAAPGCRRAAGLDLVREFDAVHQAFLSAQSANDYLQVAARLEELIGRSPASGPLLYDLGNAYARAGEAGRAVAAYRRAQRFLPRDPYLQNNLQMTQGAAPSLDGAEGGFFARLLWLPRFLSADELAWLTAALATVTFALGLVALLRPLPLWARSRNLALVATLAIALATAWSVAAGRPGMHGVLVEDGVVARTGDSESYEPAFTEPLAAATEFTLVEARGSWLHVQLPSGPRGWVPRAEALLY